MLRLIVPVEVVDLLNYLSSEATQTLFSVDEQVNQELFDSKGQLDLNNEFDAFVRGIYSLALRESGSVGDELKFMAARTLFISGYFDAIIEISENCNHAGVQAYRGVACILKQKESQGFALLTAANTTDLLVRQEILGLRAFIYTRVAATREDYADFMKVEATLDNPLLVESQAWYSVFKKDYEAAQKQFNELLIFAEEHKNRYLTALALNGVGYVNAILERYDAAQDAFTRGLSEAKQINAKFILSMLNYNFGRFYFLKGRYEDAFECYRQSYGIRKLLELDWAVIFPGLYVALTALLLGDDDFGLTFIEDIRTQIIAMKEKLYISRSANILARLWLDHGQYLKAFRLVTNLLTEVPDIQDEEHKKATLTLGLLMAYMGKGAEARESVQQAVEHARTEGEIVECLFVMSQLSAIAKSDNAVMFLARALKRAKEIPELSLKRAQMLTYQTILAVESYKNRGLADIPLNQLQLLVNDMLQIQEVAAKRRFILSSICCDLVLSQFLPQIGMADEAVKRLELAHKRALEYNFERMKQIVGGRVQQFKLMMQAVKVKEVSRYPIELDKCASYLQQIAQQFFLIENYNFPGY